MRRPQNRNSWRFLDAIIYNPLGFMGFRMEKPTGFLGFSKLQFTNVVNDQNG